MKVDEESLSEAMRRACAGDVQLYGAFFKAITPVFRGIIQAKASGLSLEEREDILQEVLLAVHSKRHTWRHDKPIRPWLFAIARYKIIDDLRKRGQRVFLDVDEFADVLPMAEAETGNAIDIERLVGQLKGKHAAVVRAIGLEERSYSDVANALGMTENAVRVNFFRGLEKLRLLGDE